MTKTGHDSRHRLPLSAELRDGILKDLVHWA
jgi:hypothetical protein